MFKPAVGKKFKLKADLKGNPTDGKSKWVITWDEDLSELKSKAESTSSALDPRAEAIETCEEWIGDRLTATIESNKATVEAESTAQHSTWSSRNAKEIFACIRAEYKYIADGGYKKVKSRIGPNGIDHLFMRDGAASVICESKTISDLSIVTRAVKRKPPQAFLSLLGEGRAIGSARGKVIMATQMSKAWIGDCLTELRQYGDAGQQEAVEQVQTDIEDGRPPERVVNIYGGLNWNKKGHSAYAELVAEAKRQWDSLPAAERKRLLAQWNKSQQIDASQPFVQSLQKNTDEAGLLYIHKRWMKADPERGRFYLLPGKYRLAGKPAWFAGTKEPNQEVDFADGKYHNDEFFQINMLSKRVRMKFDSPKKKKR